MLAPKMTELSAPSLCVDLFTFKIPQKFSELETEELILVSVYIGHVEPHEYSP